MAMDFSWLPSGQDAARLPLGMRVNNPGNIKYFRGLNYPGMLGPSSHTDQGDPQMTFDTPQSGMNAASALARRKYQGGMRTPMAIVSGKMGWTPGNVAAAQNIARTMGIDPNDDLGLDDPRRMATFLRALTQQEHGGASKLYSDDLYATAAGAGASPAQAQAATLRQRFGTKTEGGVTAPAPKQEISGATDRLKSALSKYDQDWIDTGKGLQKRGLEIASSYGNKLGAYGGAGVAALGGFLEGMEGEEKKAHDAEFAKRASEAGDTSALMNVMLSSSDPKMREAGLELKAKLLTPKTTEWVPTADGRAVVNKATGEVRQTGIDKAVTPTDVEKRAIAAGLKPGTPEYSDYVLRGPERSANPTELERRALAGGLKPGTPEYEKYVLAGPPKTATEKWNENQSKAANFGNMMTKAEALIGGMGPKDVSGKPQIGPDGQPVPAENPKGWVGAVRDSLMPFEGARNLMTPTDQQTYNQAAEQWIRAKLRKESGAAIGNEEMAKEFRTYFPQYGDSEAVIRQKADARAEATRGMISESAGAYKHFFGGEQSDGAGDNPDVPRAVKTQTIDPATGQPVPSGATPPPGQPAGPPAAAIDKLTANPTPEMRQFFDQKYGAGAADRELSRRQSQTPTQDELQQSFGAGLY